MGATAIRERSHTEYNAARNPALTPREIEVIQLAADGEDCNSSAMRLGICVGTVKHTRHSAMLKLGADGAAHMVAQALRRGIIT
jgi:DNA-binding NarL/FixJ family response regulator